MIRGRYPIDRLSIRNTREGQSLDYRQLESRPPHRAAIAATLQRAVTPWCHNLCSTVVSTAPVLTHHHGESIS
jgi:hypothetical protein